MVDLAPSPYSHRKCHRLKNFWLTEEEVQSLEALHENLTLMGHKTHAQVIAGILERITDRR